MATQSSILDGDKSDTILTIGIGADVSIANLGFENGFGGGSCGSWGCGGAVFIEQSTVGVSGSRFDFNYAAEGGGAIQLRNGGLSIVEDSSFYRNAATITARTTSIQPLDRSISERPLISPATATGVISSSRDFS